MGGLLAGRAGDRTLLLLACFVMMHEAHKKRCRQQKRNFQMNRSEQYTNDMVIFVWTNNQSSLAGSTPLSCPAFAVDSDVATDTLSFFVDGEQPDATGAMSGTSPRFRSLPSPSYPGARLSGRS